MITELVNQWEENKHKLEEYFKMTKQDEYNNYEDIDNITVTSDVVYTSLKGIQFGIETDNGKYTDVKREALNDIFNALKNNTEYCRMYSDLFFRKV